MPCYLSMCVRYSCRYVGTYLCTYDIFVMCVCMYAVFGYVTLCMYACALCMCVMYV